MIVNILRKIVPSRIKTAIANPLRKILCPPHLQLKNCQIVTAGKPGGENFWWDELKAAANRKIFPPLSDKAKQACSEIRLAYRPILQRYGVDDENFFWGSIKNEEAEALYQLVLERKPKIVYQIGTFVGYSALVIAHALRANGEGVLIAMDPEIPHRTFINPVNVAREAAQNQELDKFIRFEYGWHSCTSGDYLGLDLKRKIPVVGHKVLESIRDAGIDMAFIDGDHSSICTIADFLVLKDYLNINGVAVFHDVLSWPTVAQAILILWKDVHYYVKGTPAYFGLDVRHGQDGLAAFERIAYENFPTLCLKLVDDQANPIIDAKVEIPRVNFTAITDREGAVYAMAEIPAGTEIRASCAGYQDYSGILDEGTGGDFRERTVTLSKSKS